MPRILNIDRSHYKVGQIIFVGATVLPAGTLYADGSSLLRTSYPVLFAKIGTKFGTPVDIFHFNLPDWRGRSPVGGGQGSGLTLRSVGDVVGEESVALDITMMPAHTHPSGSSVTSAGAHEQAYNRPNSGDVVFGGEYGGVNGAFGPVPTALGSQNTGTAGAHSHTFTTASSGTTPVTHNNVSPVLVLNFAIAYI